jgi:glycosyltransferase involved in cell wall biosynthesis
VRILYLADIRFPLERANGIQTMETCYALAGRGHDVHLAVRPDTQRPARDPFAYYGLPPLDRLTIDFASTGSGLIRRSQTGQRAAYLRYAMSRALGAGFDVVFTRDLGVASLLVRIPHAMRPPIVYESHGYSPDVASALPGLVVTARQPGARKLQRLARRETRVWRDADGYVTITSGLAEHLADRLGTRVRVAVVPDGTRYASNESPSYRATEPPSDRTPTPESRTPTSESRVPNSRVVARCPIVGYAGHLYPWKGVDILLEALARVPEADGLIVGGHEREPDLGRLKDLARSLGIVDRVTFTGLVEPSAVPELLARATVLALPNPPSAISTKFTSPLKLFEYMAAGRAIVASDLPAIREVLNHNVDAILVRAGDPDALADGIRQVIEDPALAARLGQSAVANVAQYGWNRRAERLEALLEQVIAAR